MVFAVIVAWLLTALVYWEQQRSKLFWTIWLMFVASGFSLANGENLLNGFLLQVYMVLAGALASILIALKTSTAESPKGFAWLAALQLAMGFCVFSMAGGIAIPAAAFCLLILFRASLLKCFVTAGFGIVYAVMFFSLTHGGAPSGVSSASTPFELPMVFLAIIGGAPFDAGITLAAILGAVVLATLVALFAWHLVGPWLKYRKVDPGLAGLFALAAFLIVTAAVAAWDQTFMGIDLAPASRYATPMLILWMVLVALLIRFYLISQTLLANAPVGQDFLQLAVAAIFGIVAVSTLGATNESKHVMAISQAIRQTAYFAASGIEWKAHYPLAEAYSGPATVGRFMAFFHAHRLSMLAPSTELPAPSTDQIQTLASIKSIPACRGWLDDTTRIDNNSWKLRGWISDSLQRTPRWIFAADDAGRLLGFTAPQDPRPDVEQAIGASDFRGFSVPVRTFGIERGSLSVVAIFQDGQGTCRLQSPNLFFLPT
jgi:hypothetical protein